MGKNTKQTLQKDQATCKAISEVGSQLWPSKFHGGWGGIVHGEAGCKLPSSPAGCRMNELQRPTMRPIPRLVGLVSCIWLHRKSKPIVSFNRFRRRKPVDFTQATDLTNVLSTESSVGIVEKPPSSSRKLPTEGVVSA